MALLFEWNNAKAGQNLKKHRVSFEEASTVFRDPLSLTINDPSIQIMRSVLLLLGSQFKVVC